MAICTSAMPIRRCSTSRWRAMQADRLLLRMEDIDRERCTPELEQTMQEDLHWIGLRLGNTRPPPVGALCLSTSEALEQADRHGTCLSSLSEPRRYQTRNRKTLGGKDVWPRDPDGALLYPPTRPAAFKRERERRIGEGQPFSWRLNMDRALEHVGEPLLWTEPHLTDSASRPRPQDWGDVIIARKDMPTSYHLSVVIDDALQGITHVVRGKDLFHATSVHRLLQRSVRYRSSCSITIMRWCSIATARNSRKAARIRPCANCANRVRRRRRYMRFGWVVSSIATIIVRGAPPGLQTTSSRCDNTLHDLGKSFLPGSCLSAISPPCSSFSGPPASLARAMPCLIWSRSCS